MSLPQASGEAQGWGTAVECQDDACKSTVAAHSRLPVHFLSSVRNLICAEYLNTTIVLNAADSTFGNTLAINEADNSGFSSSDGGKTWAVSTINIHQHTFNV